MARPPIDSATVSSALGGGNLKLVGDSGEPGGAIESVDLLNGGTQA